MNRRRLIGGLLAMPLAAVASHLPVRTVTSRSLRGPSTKLKVALRGPFALVVQPEYEYRIRAFVPTQDGHDFWLNHNQQTGGPFHFELMIDGLHPAASIDLNDPAAVDPKFKPFLEHPPRWIWQDYYVTFDLPCPNNITFDDYTHAAFKADPATKVVLPLNHILEYDVTNLTKVRLRGYETGNQLPITPVGEWPQFDIQVGLPHSNPDPTGDKATTYHNSYILPCFPDIKNKELQAIYPTVPVAHGKETDGKNDKGTDVECKNGGLLISFPF